MQSFHSLSLPSLFAGLAAWPFDWARGLGMRQRMAERRALALAAQPSGENASRLGGSLVSLHASGLAAAFDMARSQYAAGVQAGLIERSLLASSAFERQLGGLERAALGPWARSV
jgi:hypothetical protein